MNSKRHVAGEPIRKKRRLAGHITDGRPPATALATAPASVSLRDLGGIDQVIEQFDDLILLPLRQPEFYQFSRVQPPRGILLHGPSGCGKTTIANALAADLEVNFIPISAPSIVSSISGDSEKALRNHFEEARKNAPCIMFIDEIDAITAKRDNVQKEMEKRIVSQLLLCMDSLSMSKSNEKLVIVLAATSRPDSLDIALRRPGRFDREINMGIPNESAREQILRALTRKQVVSSDVDFAALAKQTPGFVGADLNDLVLTAGAATMKRYEIQLRAEAENSKASTGPDEPGTDTLSALDRSPEESTNNTSCSSESLVLKAFYRRAEYLKKPLITAGTQESENPSPFIQTTHQDFLKALGAIQPSAKREGFATVPKTTFASIGSLSSHIRELRNTVITPILQPQVYRNAGIKPNIGTLLWGPSGNGKTLLAQAVANASHANFISVKGPELLNKYVGESERAVRQIFHRARDSVPVIIFFDEIDALVPRRDGLASEASTRVVNTMLTELDGFDASGEGIFVIAATNRPDIIDPAILRPGRLGTKLYVGLPDAEGRVDILRTLCKDLRNFVFDENIAQLARKCDGFSGADLHALLTRAGYAAIERWQDSDQEGAGLTYVDFESARGEVHRSMSVEDIQKFDRLRREWGRVSIG